MRKFFVFLAVFCVTAAMITGCSREQGTEGQQSGADKGQSEVSSGDDSGISDERKIVFQADTVFAVNGEPVSEGEWNLYAIPEQEKADRLYGDGIWDYQINAEGKLFSEALKEEIIRQISCVKIVAGRADEYGIELTDDEQVEISIQTADYMERLTGEQRSKYGVTEELVRKVYSENLLAMKVYEHLTLNVDTSTDEEQVRHMELQYVVVSKFYEDEDGNPVMYSEGELEAARQRLKAFVAQAGDNGFGKTANGDGADGLADSSNGSENGNKGNGSLADGVHYVRLSDLDSEEFTVTDIVAGLADLKERFSDELAGVAFWLRENEISDILETEEAFFVFECVKLTDKDATDAARIEVIEQREKDVFNACYEKWEKEAYIQLPTD